MQREKGGKERSKRRVRKRGKEKEKTREEKRSYIMIVSNFPCDILYLKQTTRSQPMFSNQKPEHHFGDLLHFFSVLT